MKITDIRTMKLVGPRLHSLGGDVGQFSKTIVRVDTDAGIYGLGEAEHFVGVRDAITYMKHYFMGRDPFQVNAIISEMLYATLPPHHPEAKHGIMADNIAACPTSSPTATHLGPVLWACSAVDMALCDLVGKALKTPAYNLLGGKFRDKIRIYLDRSAPDNVADPSAWKKLASETVEAGFSQMKFDIDYIASDVPGDLWNRTITRRQLNRIVERLTLVRETVGPDFELCVDCHALYTVPDAIRLAQLLEPLRLLWLEDPTPVIHPDSCAEVAAKSPIAICVGEMFSLEQFRLFLERKACNILHPDVLFCGGMHAMRRIADLGEVHDRPVAMHGNGGALATLAAAHAAAASRNFLGLEYHFIETDWISTYVTRGEPLFKDGHVVLTDAPGLGIELDRAVCKKYLAPGETLL